jgi:hypothetical protein
MKSIISLFVFVYVFASCTGFSKDSGNISKNDIDIFIKCYDEIAWFMVNTEKSNNYDNDWKQYFELTPIPFKGTDSIESFNNYFQTLLNLKVPKELELVFEEKGWQNNGHEKYWIICHGFTFIHWKKDFEEKGWDKTLPDRYLLIKNLLELFNSSDVNIIDKNYERISNMLRNLYK